MTTAPQAPQPFLDSGDISEALGHDPDESPREDLAATAESDPNAKIEFHVQMRSWTMHDMEGMIVEAAASQVIRQVGDKQIQKLIEDRAITAITAKADAKIDAVTADIIDQPLTPNFGDKNPVTMREFIGLYAKEYLTETVDREGKPAKSGGWGRDTIYTRAELIVMKAIDRQFKEELSKATSSAIVQIQADLRNAHAAILEEEKARIRNAVTKATS